MTTRITPKLRGHSGMSPGGKEAPYLCDDYEVRHQGEPTDAVPMNRKKSLRGETGLPPPIPSFK